MGTLYAMSSVARGAMMGGSAVGGVAGGAAGAAAGSDFGLCYRCIFVYKRCSKRRSWKSLHSFCFAVGGALKEALQEQQTDIRQAAH
ncbi:hypothetical protein [Ruminococcus sp.]|uniref:hypothetical protein n=1 Tax=Ruminococcus sp. TaxID=41978 RepID=UPI0039A05BFD